MISLENLISSPDHYKNLLSLKNFQLDVNLVNTLGLDRKKFITESDSLKHRRNYVSKLIGDQKRKPTKEEISEMRLIGDKIKNIDKSINSLEVSITNYLLTIPNIPDEDVPDGLDESKNIEVKRFGELTLKKSKPHWEIGSDLDIIDMSAGASISGSRFYVLRGYGSRLQRAISSWMLDIHVEQNGYLEIDPPYLVKRDTMIGSGNLPKFEENLYHDTETDLWLIPTAEVALNALHQNQIIDPLRLPLKYVSRTPSFRKEHTAAGRDVRGIKRVHQFEKVEMFRYVEPNHDEFALEEMIEEASYLCKELELVHRVIKLCTGDLGFQSSKTYDIEVWAPGSKEWLEVSSISTCKDFQTRRNNTRYRPKIGSSTKFPYTLNGSGLALPRILIAILENGLESDGSITIPKVLVKYTGWEKIENK